MSDSSSHAPSGNPGVEERSYTVPADVPALPLRDTVLFPSSFMPVAVAGASCG